MSMKVKFKETNKVFFKIVEVGGEKYILDLTTVSPKSYFWGSLPDEITAKMQKLDKRDMRFESVAPTMSKSIGVAIGVAIGGSGYRLVTNFFRNNGISHNLPLKIGLYGLFIFLAYLAFWFIAIRARHSVQKRLENKVSNYQITFKPVGNKRQLKHYKLLPFILVPTLGCFAFYLYTVNGTEGALLVINSILLLGFFTVILGMSPLRESVEKQEIIFDRIEKL